MAIIIRHRTLSQKTQSAIAGIISKNEWNDTHVIDTLLEADISFSSSTGHNHDGVSSAISAKSLTLRDSYLSSTDYRSASKYPQANEIPILDGDGYMNIRRVGTTQFSKVLFTDGLTVKSGLFHDFTATSLYITNIVGTNYLYLLASGEVSIVPKATLPLTITTDNVHLKNIVATDNSEVKLCFKDSVGTAQGCLGYKFHATASSNILSLKNLKSNAGGNINLDGAGNIILNAKGISGKTYYTHNEVAPVANDEVATKLDILGLRITNAISNSVTYNYSGSGNLTYTIPQIGFVWDLQFTTGLGWQGTGIHSLVHYYANGTWRPIVCNVYYNPDGVVNTIGLSDITLGNNADWPYIYLFFNGQPLISNGSNIKIQTVMNSVTTWNLIYKVATY